jgi:hypothetical protein
VTRRTGDGAQVNRHGDDASFCCAHGDPERDFIPAATNCPERNDQQ